MLPPFRGNRTAERDEILCFGGDYVKYYYLFKKFLSQPVFLLLLAYSGSSQITGISTESTVRLVLTASFAVQMTAGCVGVVHQREEVHPVCSLWELRRGNMPTRQVCWRITFTCRVESYSIRESCLSATVFPFFSRKIHPATR